MLIITRRPGETLVVQLPDGSTAEIVVLGTKGNQVRLGCIAEKETKLYREEIYQRIQAEEQQKKEQAA